MEHPEPDDLIRAKIMLNISDDELALCISDHELAPYNSHHELSLCVWARLWSYRKGPDQGRYRERPDQSHSAAHSKINQVKSAEKLLKALRGSRIQRSGHRWVWSVKGHFSLGSHFFSRTGRPGAARLRACAQAAQHLKV